MSRSLLAQWREAIGDSDLSGPTKAVGCWLSTYMDRSGVAWPGVSTLAARCSYSRRRVVYAIAELEGAGLLSVERGYGTTTSRYTAVVHEVHDSGAPHDTRRAPHDRRRARGAPKSVERLEQGGASLDATPPCSECGVGGGRHAAGCSAVAA